MIIVTGAYGFIGSHIVKRLNYRGKSNIVLVDDLTNGAKYTNLLDAKFQQYYDVDEFICKFKNWDNVTAVYHQGAISSTVERNGKLMLQRNYSFTQDLLNKCIEYQVPVSYASSASVYGNRTDGEFEPLNLYAYSKMLVDQWVLTNMKKFRLIQGWRYFNVYGNNETHKGDQSSPITKFTNQAKAGVIQVFTGSSKIYRDFIAVDDVVDVVVSSMDMGLPSGIRDLGTGNPISFLDVAKLIQKKHGGKIEEIPFPDHLRSQYQYMTKSTSHPAKQYMTVAQWIDSHENR